jgi:heme oxygenase
LQNLVGVEIFPRTSFAVLSAQNLPKGVILDAGFKTDIRMQKDSRRWQLRERTATAHQELDALVGEFDSDASYRRYLTGTAAFRLGVEPWLASAVLPANDTYHPSEIGPELREDLAELGLSVPAPVPLAVDRSPSATLGVLYVLEGSALGAQLLVKRAAALGFDGMHGARHLVRQTHSLQGWRGYLKLLDEAEPFDMDACIAAATATFDTALKAFEAKAYA